MSASPTTPLALSAHQAGAGGVTIGSLCSGYEGLGMAVQQVLGGRLTWVADPDPGASAVLAHHWPDVPNLGDITVTRWEDVERVDLVCAGFPCQDISYAGRGEGIQEGNRSGLWHVIADALGVLRPRVVVLENVRAIVARRPGLDVVLADLADLGFDADWTCVRASDVGAPHGRSRWFLVAHAQDERHERGRRARGRRPGPADGGLPAADAPSVGPGEGRTEPAGQQGRLDAPLGGHAPADADRDALRAQRHGQPQQCQADHEPRGLDPVGRALDWGRYGPAVDRWERVLGRTAPVPRLPTGRGGGDQLNPVFVEWMQGLPAGHVTAVPGLTRNQQLKLLGNGVVPQQGAHALSLLLARTEVPAWT